MDLVPLACSDGSDENGQLFSATSVSGYTVFSQLYS